MTEKWWLGWGITLFRLEKDSNNPIWLKSVSIEMISWVDLQEGWINLSGHLPAAKELVALKDSDSLLILYKDCGDMSEFIHNQIVIRLDNCKIDKKWIENIEGENAVELNVSLEGKMSFFWGQP